MPLRRYLLLSFFPSLFLFRPASFAQTNPPPADPHEMVTRQPRILSKPAERNGALDLLARARKNFDLSDAHVLKASFESNGATQSEGLGTMEDLSDGNSHWRWMADLQQAHIIRIGADSRVFGSPEPVPLRIQMAHSILQRPVLHDRATEH